MKQTSVQQKKCPKCARLMVALTLDIENEKRTLRSCSHCDVREWEAVDGSISLAGVLDELSDSASR
ncbi:MAG: hypothetical protein R8J94_12590 [Acidimicrobiia bacterium]|nr:hypothetical protein [Acidimicrobiia bacterium]